jgi:hypothetical protein
VIVKDRDEETQYVNYEPREDHLKLPVRWKKVNSLFTILKNPDP